VTTADLHKQMPRFEDRLEYSKASVRAVEVWFKRTGFAAFVPDQPINGRGDKGDMFVTRRLAPWVPFETETHRVEVKQIGETFTHRRDLEWRNIFVESPARVSGYGNGGGMVPRWFVFTDMTLTHAAVLDFPKDRGRMYEGWNRLGLPWFKIGTQFLTFWRIDSPPTFSGVAP